MSTIPKKKKKNPVWICADVWFGIFPLLPPRQLGIEVARVNGRFDRLVDDHFISRKWTLGHLRICDKFWKNRTNGMLIEKCVNPYSLKPLPIPDENISLPDGVVGFDRIDIHYIDQNAMAFLHRIRPLFSTCGINLNIVPAGRKNRRISEFFFANIWPLIKGNICGMDLSSLHREHFRHFPSTILSDCPNLKTIVSDDIFSESPADDSANVSIGQAVAKWLCTPSGNDIPKMVKCILHSADKVQAIKRVFANSSFPVNFVVAIWKPYHVSFPFELINTLTVERLALKQFSDDFWLLVRCPISRHEKQWAEWEREAIEWNWYKKWNKLGIFAQNIAWSARLG